MSVPPATTSSSMRSTDASTNQSTAEAKKPPRQRPGSACTGCRARKLRCDGVQPQCGSCFEAGVSCETPGANSRRGPKKGHMKALHLRLANVEQQLKEAQAQQLVTTGVATTDLVAEEDEGEEEAEDVGIDSQQRPVLGHQRRHTTQSISQNLDQNPPSPPAPSLHSSRSRSHSTRTAGYETLETLSSRTSISGGISLPDDVCAELDQLYFERAHPFVPIFNRHRYFLWTRLPEKSAEQSCIQHAMWTLAASLSPQLQHMCDDLYDATRRKLDALDMQDMLPEASLVGHVQAHLLVSIYEVMHKSQQQTWMTAGRCFRLLQLSRLYEIDSPEYMAQRTTSQLDEDMIVTEEKRRSFWMAYILDRLIGLRLASPLTLNEHVIHTRLPAPEDDFQNGIILVEMPFLSDAVVSVDTTIPSCFAELIILATLCGRVLAHDQQTNVEQIYGNTLEHFWERQFWLGDSLKARADGMMLNYPTPYCSADPMLIFTNMVAQTAVLYLWKVMDRINWDDDEYATLVTAFKEQSLFSALEILNLSRSLANLGYFKMHPFTPIPLYFCMDYFSKFQDIDLAAGSNVHEIKALFRDMQDVNSLAKSYLDD